MGRVWRKEREEGNDIIKISKNKSNKNKNPKGKIQAHSFILKMFLHLLLSLCVCTYACVQVKCDMLSQRAILGELVFFFLCGSCGSN